MHHGGKGALERRVLEIVNFIVAVSARPKMRMAIDQSRKHGGMGKIDNGCSRRNGGRACRRNTLNAIPHYNNHHVVARFVAGPIKQMPRANIDSLWRGRWRGWRAEVVEESSETKKIRSR